jgi:serine/threonine protein kinase
VIGEHNVNDFYDVSTSLGKGQFGVVKLASHKKSKNKVAIK